MTRNLLFLEILGTCLGAAAIAAPADALAGSLLRTAVPSFEGARYEVEVPDTLDLAERMKLSLNAFTRCVDGPPAGPFPPTRYRCNHFIAVNPRPQVLRNVVLYGKFMESALLARMVTGVETNLDVDEDWRRAWLAWSQIDPVMHGPEGGRRLCWIAANCIREADTGWAEAGHRAVVRLGEAAVPYKEGAWIHVGFQNTPPDEGCSGPAAARLSPQAIAEMRKADRREAACGWNGTFMSWTLQGLCRLYEATGDNYALSLAGRLARYLKDDAEILAPDGRFLAGHPHPWPVVHFHHNCITAQALLEYGIAGEDREYVDFVRRVYEHVMTFCSRDTGFAPEYCYGKFPRQQAFDNTEACCSADLVMMALLLTRAGAGDYWDDVDRYVRNHIAALQLVDTRWFYGIPENRDAGLTYPDPKIEAMIGPLTGNFGGWTGVNEWHIPQLGPGIMTCCVSNCTRAFYHVHRRMVEYGEDTLKIHLLLNHASPWAEMGSWIPYEGKVEIRLRRSVRHVLVRAPEWVKAGSPEIQCAVDDRPHPTAWTGRYLDIGSAEPGSRLTVTFPIFTRIIDTEIGRQQYKLTIKGNTVTEIDPPGVRIPLYRRDDAKQGKAATIRVRRYVPPEKVWRAELTTRAGSHKSESGPTPPEAE